MSLGTAAGASRLNWKMVAILAALASVVLGAAVVMRPTLAVAVVALGAFVLLWFGPRWAILVVPVAWMLVGDPVLIQMTGAAAWSPFYLAMDAWTLLALGALFVSAGFRDTAARLVLRSPFGVGVAVLWMSFAISEVLGHGAGVSLSTQWSDARGVLYAGWLLVASYVFVSCRSKGASFVLALGAGGVVVKGLVFYALGIGLRGASYVAGYRAFGSEETTVGLILLAVGLAVVGNRAVPRGLALASFATGTVIVLLGSLRAYLLASVLVVVAIIVLQGARSPGRSLKVLAWLGAAAAAAVLVLATVARRFYDVTLAKRLQSLLVGTSGIQSDISLGYRFVEFGTVREAVGRSVLFGAGLGATHRGVLIYNPTDVLQQAVLPGYVHNSFLWSYLKAGFVGVAGCVAYYVGTIVEPVRVLRHAEDPLVRDIALAFAVVGGALVFVGLFNALIASVRYEIVVGVAFGWFFGVAHGSAKEAEEAGADAI